MQSRMPASGRRCRVSKCECVTAMEQKTDKLQKKSDKTVFFLFINCKVDCFAAAAQGRLQTIKMKYEKCYTPQSRASVYSLPLL